MNRSPIPPLSARRKRWSTTKSPDTERWRRGPSRWDWTTWQDCWKETLEEEKAADKKLSEVADGILAEAASMEGGSKEDEEDEETTMDSPRKKAASKGGNGQTSRHRAG